MKISALITAFNHADYIERAIQSALEQEVDCDYEIVVGEDASTDGTRELVSEIAARHAGKVRLLLVDRALAENERATGREGKTNFRETLKACTGDYVAFLDGDDYWTDMRKLTKQAQFLEAHPDHAMCFHDAMVVDGSGNVTADHWARPGQKTTSSLEDLLGGNFILTSTAMMRTGYFAELPPFFDVAAPGDWGLFIIYARYGLIGYLDEVLAAYRVHSTNWGARTMARRSLATPVRLLMRANAYLGYEQDALIQTRITELIERETGEAGQHIRNLEAERVELRAHVANLEAESVHLRAHIGNLERERANLQAHTENLEIVRENLGAQVASLTEERERFLEHVANLESERARYRALLEAIDDGEKDGSPGPRNNQAGV